MASPTLLPALLCVSALAAPLVTAAQPKPQRPAEPMQGVITRVIDGDTVLVSQPGQPALTVRLRDIDAPEPCQVWGEQARQALAALALNKAVSVQPTGRDGQGRMVATLRLDGSDLSVRMVEEGHAWSVRWRDDRGPLVRQERMAAALNRGLHADKTAVMPRVFRRTNGPCKEP